MVILLGVASVADTRVIHLALDRAVGANWANYGVLP